MQNHYSLAGGGSYYPDSALNAIVETAVLLVMEEGLAAAEEYLRAQGISRHPPTTSPFADNVCHRPCQAGPR